MATHNIVIFRGDHCGPQVVAEAIKVLKAIESTKPSAGKFTLNDQLLGGASLDATGSPLTDEALEAAKNADAVLLGAIGGPQWDKVTERPEKGLLKLRKEMGTYANLRPTFFPSKTLVDNSPLKREICENTNFTIVRELTGGIYFGDRKEDDGSGFAMDTEPYSRAEIERITELAVHMSAKFDPPAPIISLHKANVLATSRLWRDVVDQTIEKVKGDFPHLDKKNWPAGKDMVTHQLIDSAALLMMKSPTKLNGVIIASNLFGDIISDEASAIPGSIGLSPSASLSGIPDGKSRCNGIYEPIHGSAPDIADKGTVNPIGTILSVAMMCRYSLGLPEEANAIETAVREVLDGGLRTCDLDSSNFVGTKEMGDAITQKLVEVLQRA